MELLAKLCHVVAWNVLFFLEFANTMREGAIISEFTFAKVYHIFAHFRFLLFFNVRVELLSLLITGEGLLVFLPGGFTKSLGSGRRVVRAMVRAVLGGRRVMSAVFIRLRGRWHEGLEVRRLLLVSHQGLLASLVLHTQSSLVV